MGTGGVGIPGPRGWQGWGCSRNQTWLGTRLSSPGQTSVSGALDKSLVLVVEVVGGHRAENHKLGHLESSPCSHLVSWGASDKSFALAGLSLPLCIMGRHLQF